MGDGGRLVVPAVSTIWRILSRRGFVDPQPQKRPRSSWRTFCADQPNERWQADITHGQLADGTEVGVLNIIDDHSRLHIAGDARRTTSGLDVVASFRKAFNIWGIPAGVLTDIQAWCAALSLPCRPAGKDRCRPAPVRHRCLTDWSAQRLLAR
jgi:Integrase core domain